MNSRPGLLQIGQPADLAGFAFRKPTFSLTDSTLQLRFSVMYRSVGPLHVQTKRMVLCRNVLDVRDLRSGHTSAADRTKYPCAAAYDIQTRRKPLSFGDLEDNTSDSRDHNPIST